MFGLDGFGVAAGFGLTLVSTLLCVVYGVRNWNRGYFDPDQAERKQAWDAEEQQLEENL